MLNLYQKKYIIKNLRKTLHRSLFELLDFITLIGFEATKKIMLKYAGVPILIPKSATSKYKHQYILDNYDGTKKSRMKLALECNITERYVYKIIKQYKKEN